MSIKGLSKVKRNHSNVKFATVVIKENNISMWIKEQCMAKKNISLVRFDKKCFGYSSNLNAHRRTVHSREKPFQCEIYQKSFVLKHCLDEQRERSIKTRTSWIWKRGCWVAIASSTVEPLYIFFLSHVDKQNINTTSATY